MEHAGHQHQHQYHLSSAMTKLPAGLTAPGHGCTTALTHRYQIKYLHQPHLALPPAAPAAPEEPTAEAQLERPLKRLKTEHQSSPDAATEATDKRYQHLQRLQTVPDVHQRQHQPQQQQQHVVSTRHHQQQQHPQQQQQQTQQTQQTQQPRVNRQSGPRPQVPPASTHVSCLYPEILAMIFSNLDVRSRGRAAQVCTTWRDAAYHKSVWRGVEARLHLKKHATSVFNSLEKRGIKKVQILSLSARRSLYDVFRGIKNLQSLNLSGCYNMTDSGLNSALAKPFPSLTELNLSLCKNITDASLHRIAENLKSLEVLHLGGCGNITNSGLQWLAWGLKRLKRLDLRSCWHISDSGLSYLAGRNPEFGGNLALEHLGLQDCQRLSDEGLKHISEGLAHSLRSINLSFCVLITDSGMKHVARVSSLRELDLRSCDNISEIGISYLVEGGSRISSLDVSFCDKIGDQALQYISQGLFNLKSLSLSACPISDEGISKIAKTQQELETLLIGQCSRLTDKSVVTIVDNMPLLKCIDLYGCTRISKFGLDKIDKLRVSLNLGLWQERR